MTRRPFAALVLVALSAMVLTVTTAAPAGADMSIRLEKKVVGDLRRGDRDAVSSYLLTNGEPDATNNDGEPLLVIAARHNKPDMIDLLLRHGARVNATDRLGNTALFWAADAGHTPITRALIEAGAKVDSQNRQGLTPLMTAVRAGHMEIVRTLVAGGADPRTADYTGRDAFGWAVGPRGPLLVNELNKAQ
jgi:ankyrin repeat protein